MILPAHNEAGNIAPLCAALKAELAPLGGFEIVFVDDGSTDGTLDSIKATAASDTRVGYVAFTRNFGHQAALRAGLRRARGAAVVVMDCDFEHPPQLIREMAARWREGARVVCTLRIDPADQVSFLKRWTSAVFYRLLNSIGDVRIEPGSSDFMLLDRVVVDKINALDDQDVFLRGIVRWFGYPIVQLEFQRGSRQSGESKFTPRRMIELAVSGIAGHSMRPLRLAIYLALGFAGIGFAFVLYSIVSFYFVQHTVAGWTSIMAAIAILGAAQLLVLGVFGEYLGRLLREARKRPHYIVAETDADRHS
ncbi:MAG: glycosyltransferase family 2 protein [Xanthobacteraceae bacterium]